MICASCVLTCRISSTPRRTSSENLSIPSTPAETADCISFTIWDVDDADSWVPGTFLGEGYATLYDTNLKPKPAYTTLQQTLTLATGAPRRPGPGH